MPLHRLAAARQRLLGDGEALAGHVGLHHAPVARVRQALHQPAALEAVDQLGHVGPRDAQLVAEGVEARAPAVAAAQHLEDLELRVGEAVAAGVAVEAPVGRARHAVEGLARPARQLGARAGGGRFRVHDV